MRKILIVSEKSIITKSMQTFCEEQGASVQQVIKGAQALQLLFIEKFDMIICSVFIEDYDGVQLVSGIKASFSLNSTTPIVMITSNASVEQFFNNETKPELVLLKQGNILEEFQHFYQECSKSTQEVTGKVLYIDDDPFIQKIIRSWFVKLPSIDLVMCGSISELKETDLEGIDIIVSDNLLKDGNIEDVLDVIQESILKNFPIIVYAGTVDKLDLSLLQKKANVLDILAKPFDMKKFLKTLKQVKSKIS